jgi:hypothetical protein
VELLIRILVITQYFQALLRLVVVSETQEITPQEQVAQAVVVVVAVSTSRAARQALRGKVMLVEQVFQQAQVQVVVVQEQLVVQVQTVQLLAMVASDFSMQLTLLIMQVAVVVVVEQLAVQAELVVAVEDMAQLAGHN